MRYLLMLLLLTACSSRPTASAGPINATPTSAAAVTKPSPIVSNETPVTLKGTGGSKSEMFSLQGGTYAVEWTTRCSAPNCAFSPDLEAVDGKFSQQISNLVVTGDQQGRSTLTKIPPGRYVIDTSTTCDTWTFIISPAH